MPRDSLFTILFVLPIHLCFSIAMLSSAFLKRTREKSYGKFCFIPHSVNTSGLIHLTKSELIASHPSKGDEGFCSQNRTKNWACI